MLTDFFRINMPYGIAKNPKGEWMAFNREYMPLGYNDECKKGLPGISFLDLPIYTRYKNISESKLIKVAWSESGIERDLHGDIVRVFLYNDGTNPMNQSSDKISIWDDYFKRLKILLKLKRE